MSISNDKATAWDEVGWTAPEILSRAQTSDAVSYLVRYFAPADGGTGDLMTGASFSDLGGGGDRPEVANVITAEDIVAVESLSVTIQRIHQLQLLGSGVTSQGRAATRDWIEALEPDRQLNVSDYPSAVRIPIDAQRVTAALARIPNNVDLADVPEDEAPEIIRNANLLWREVRRANLGQTMVSKLLARKRPRLLPIIDNLVVYQLRYKRGNVNFYESMWKVMSDKELALSAHLAAVRNTAYEDSGDDRIRGLSDLRVFDIVVWMDGKNQSNQD